MAVHGMTLEQFASLPMVWPEYGNLQGMTLIHRVSNMRPSGDETVLARVLVYLEPTEKFTGGLRRLTIRSSQVRADARRAMEGAAVQGYAEVLDMAMSLPLVTLA